MGLFRKSDKNDKQLKNDAKESTYERIVFEKLESDQDDYLVDLVNQMTEGNPLILNFELLNIDQANKVMAFFSGVIYAIKGQIVTIQEKVFMFANKDVYLDGSMEEFLKDIVE